MESSSLTITLSEDRTSAPFAPQPSFSAASSLSDSNNNSGGSNSIVITSGPSNAGVDSPPPESQTRRIEASEEGPMKKKAKLSAGLGQASVSSGQQQNKKVSGAEKLEQRLGGILCCAVCIDLPKSAVYQCTNGHLMCSGCFTHLLADARLKDETASCPNCRCVLTRDLCSRNLAVEKAVSELPGLCRFCSKELPRALLGKHETDICEERNIVCGFARIGCPWRGPYHELGSHEQTCLHPNQSGRDVVGALEQLDKQAKDEKKLYDSIFDLLSFEKITFNDLQFKPYRTDEFIHRLYYETSRFTAFNNQWVVKARVNDDQKDPTQSCDRKISYQLVLKSKIPTPFVVHYLVLKGPFGDMKVNPRLNRFEFTESNPESPYTNLPVVDTAECNKLLAAKAINFRLIMFQMPK